MKPGATSSAPGTTSGSLPGGCSPVRSSGTADDATVDLLFRLAPLHDHRQGRRARPDPPETGPVDAGRVRGDETAHAVRVRDDPPGETVMGKTPFSRSRTISSSTTTNGGRNRYPNMLREEAIPAGAPDGGGGCLRRDHFPRVYKPALTHEEAVRRDERETGDVLRPDVMERLPGNQRGVPRDRRPLRRRRRGARTAPGSVSVAVSKIRQRIGKTARKADAPLPYQLRSLEYPAAGKRGAQREGPSESPQEGGAQ